MIAPHTPTEGEFNSHVAAHWSVCEPICEVVVQERCDTVGAQPTTARYKAASSS